MNAKEKIITKITRDLFDMTREEIRAYIKALSSGASENSSGITFTYKGFTVWAGNFINNRASEISARKNNL